MSTVRLVCGRFQVQVLEQPKGDGWARVLAVSEDGAEQRGLVPEAAVQLVPLLEEVPPLPALAPQVPPLVMTSSRAGHVMESSAGSSSSSGAGLATASSSSTSHRTALHDVPAPAATSSTATSNPGGDHKVYEIVKDFKKSGAGGPSTACLLDVRAGEEVSDWSGFGYTAPHFFKLSDDLP